MRTKVIFGFLIAFVVAWAALGIWREVSLFQMFSMIMAHDIAMASGQTSQLPKEVEKYFEERKEGQFSVGLFKMDLGMRFAQIPAWLFHGLFAITTLALIWLLIKKS
jgi:hypothetical protein